MNNSHSQIPWSTEAAFYSCLGGVRLYVLKLANLREFFGSGPLLDVGQYPHLHGVDRVGLALVLDMLLGD